MAASRGRVPAGVGGELDTEDQAALDQMRAADTAPAEDAAPQPEDAPASAPGIVEPEETGQPRQPGTVPHAALHAEREEHKKTKQELDEARRNQRILEERTNLILQRINQPPQPQLPQPAPIPDINADPVGHIVGTLQAQGATMQQITAALQQQAQMAQHQQAVVQLQNQAVAAESEFATRTPDYGAAIAHLRNFRTQQLAELGYNPVERQNMIQAEALGIAGRAMQMGKNPGEVLYALATQSGYRTTPADTPATAGGTERMSQIAAGQQQARGLGGARGGGAAPLTVETVLKMSDAEFDKIMKTPQGQALLGV